MKHLFVSYDIAKQLKALGFDEPCFMTYLNGTSWNGVQLRLASYTRKQDGEVIFENDKYGIPAPTHQQVVDWFREKHKMDVRVFPKYADENNDYKTCWGWNITELEWGEDKEHHIAKSIKTFTVLDYYAALNAAIDEAIKLITA